jgi:hypothetical protein
MEYPAPDIIGHEHYYNDTEGDGRAELDHTGLHRPWWRLFGTNHVDGA